MKLLITLITATLFSFNALADAGDYPKMVCQQYDRKTDTVLPLTVVLLPRGEAKDKLDDNGLWMGMEIPYAIEVFNGPSWKPMTFKKGSVFTEDVYFKFTSEDSNVTFTVYLDEMEESSLKIVTSDSVIRGDFYCR